MIKHSKHYYEFDRNKTNTTGDDRVPLYYVGKNGYTAREVCDNFDLTYHLGTAVTYILRAYKKHDTPIECIRKAIAHLEFELENLMDEKEEDLREERIYNESFNVDPKDRIEE